MTSIFPEYDFVSSVAVGVTLALVEACVSIFDVVEEGVSHVA